MKSIHFFALIAIYLNNSVLAHVSVCSFIRNDYKVCKRNDTLELVEDNSPEGQDRRGTLEFSDPSVSSIALSAFRNTWINSLVLCFADKLLKLQSCSFSGLPKLNKLSILSGFVSLEKDLFRQVPTLRSLTLKIYGKNVNLKDAFRELKHLEHLKVHDTNFGCIHLSTFNNFHPNITYLDLKMNQITDIEPMSFIPLRHLVQLDLSLNNLTNLRPQVFYGLHQLQNLSIVLNRISSIRRSVFQELYQLQTLDLSGNEINYINTHAFDGMGISCLSLAENKLQIVEYQIFDGLSKLRTLILDHNEIYAIEQKAFAGLRLSLLSLRNNKLKTIKYGAFQLLSADKIDLSNNAIIEVNHGAFPEMKGSYEINLLHLHNVDIIVNRGIWEISNSTEI